MKSTPKFPELGKANEILRSNRPNVLVSALLSKHADSPTVVIMEKVFDEVVIPVFSQEILNEYSEVLNRRKFSFKPSTVNDFLNELKKRGLLLEPMQANIILPDMKDVPFYAVTLAHGEDNTFLVTGNLKHFPVLPFIVTPAQFLEILQKQE